MSSVVVRWRVHSTEALERYIQTAVNVSPDHPILIDEFLEGAVELDVDVIADGQEAVIGGVMEQLRAGVHSGDSAAAAAIQIETRF